MSKEVIIDKIPKTGILEYIISLSTKLTPYIKDKGIIIGEYVCNTNEFIILIYKNKIIKMEEKSEIVKRTIVKSKHIENIKDTDFEHSVVLKFKEPINICFYGEDKHSHHALRSFVSAADNVEGLKFGVVNALMNEKVLNRFKSLDDEDDPYHWAKFVQLPFILTYRSGHPQAFYNGNVDDKSLEFFFENLSHVKGYKEKNSVPLKLDHDENLYLRTSYV